MRDQDPREACAVVKWTTSRPVVPVALEVDR